MKPHWVRLIKISLTLGVLGFLLIKVKAETIVSALARVEPYWLFIAVLLGAAMVALRWFKWHLLVKSGLGFATGSQTFASLLGGMAFALVTPARVGELSRVAFLSTGKRAEAGGLVLVDRFIDLSVVLIFATIGILAFLGASEAPLLVVLSLVIASLVLAIFKLDFFLRLGSNLVPIKKLRDLISSASTGLERLPNKVLAVNLALTLIMTLLDLFCLYVLVRALGETNFKAVAFAYPLIMLTNLVPITISGLGIRESTSVMLFTKFFAIPSAIAFNATFLSYLLNSLTPALIGIYFFRKLNQK